MEHADGGRAAAGGHDRLQTATTHPGLVLSHGTLRYADFSDRLAAAAAADFTAIGLTVQDYRILRDRRWTDHDLRAALESYGLRISEVELIVGFSGPDGPANVPERPGVVYADPGIEADAFHMADTFGVRHLQAVGRFDSGPPGTEAVPTFAALCDRAGGHGLQVALEFVPYTSIPDLRTAVDIVTAADRDNGGLCVDSWHFFRGTADFDGLQTVPSDRALMVQVNDGPNEPSNSNQMADAVSGRLCPGEGDFDLERFLCTLWESGVRVDLSVEAFSTGLQRLPAVEAAGRAARTTPAVLAAIPDMTAI